MAESGVEEVLYGVLCKAKRRRNGRPIFADEGQCRRDCDDYFRRRLILMGDFDTDTEI